MSNQCRAGQKGLSERPRKIWRWEVLTKIIQEKRYRVGAEIGVFKAVNAANLLGSVCDLRLFGIDYMPTKESVELAHLYPIRFTLIVSKSISARALFPNGSLDFVFIDADHSEQAVRSDIVIYLHAVRKGGMVLGHDYGHLRHTGVKKAVDDIFGDAVQTYPDFVWGVDV